GRPWTMTVLGGASDNPALAAVWGRGQVRKLEDRYLVDADRAGLEKRIVETSLRFGVLSRFTAYVAVDRSEVVNSGGENRQIAQRVEMPAGWAEAELGTLGGARGAMPACRASNAVSYSLRAQERVMAPASLSARKSGPVPTATPPPAKGEIEDS